MPVSNPQNTYVSNFNAQDQQVEGVQLLTNDKGHMYSLSKLFIGETLGDEFKVTPTNPASAQVTVNQGYIQIYNTANNFYYHGWAEADSNINVPALSNNVIYSIVAYIDMNKQYPETVTNNPGLIVIKAIAGTPATSPVAPDNAKITSSVADGGIGGEYPYTILANVFVATGSSIINETNITDMRAPVRLADNAQLGSNTVAAGVTPSPQSSTTNPIKIAVIRHGGQIPTATDGSDLLVFELAS